MLTTLRVKLLTAGSIVAGTLLLYQLIEAFDFQVYYAAGQSLLAGRTDLFSSDFAIDARNDYRYPPIFILLFLPFALLPFTASALLWIGLGLSAIVAAFKKIAAMAAELNQTTKLKLALVLASLLTAKYLVIALKVQNVHLLLVAAIFISFWLILNERLLSASMLLAVAIAIKVFPVILLPYFAIKRQWRLLGMTTGFVLMLVLLPAYYFGINGNIDLHQQWYTHVAEESEFYDLNGPPNLSIQGQTTRFLTTVDYEARVQDKAYANVNFVDLDRSTANFLGNVVAGIICLATFVILFFADRSRVKNNTDAGREFGNFALCEFGFLICMMLLVGPRTNRIYFIALFVPLLVLTSAFLERRSLLLWISWSVALFTSILVPFLPGAKIQRLLLVLGVDTLATLVIWFALGWILIYKPRPNGAPQYP